MALRVLIVDDDPGIRDFLKILLDPEPEIEAVALARDGAEALMICGEFRPHLVLLDYRMPGLDGRDTAKHLRAFAPDALIVAYSWECENDPEWADAFISKDHIPEAEDLVALFAARLGHPSSEGVVSRYASRTTRLSDRPNN